MPESGHVFASDEQKSVIICSFENDRLFLNPVKISAL